MTEYIADPGTDDPAKLLRERDITIRHLKALLAEADDEIAKRERVIGALIADGLGKRHHPLTVHASTAHTARNAGVLTKPCLACGEDAEPGQSRCADCRPQRTPQASATQRGYPAWWARLSARARQLQPWCSTCGSPDNLTVDHTPAAWAKVQAGKRLTLRDFENGLLSVQCLRHNVALGHARGDNVTHTGRSDPRESPPPVTA